PAPGPVAGLVEQVLLQPGGGGPVVGFGLAQRPGRGAPLGRGAGGRGLVPPGVPELADTGLELAGDSAGLAADDPADQAWADIESAGDAGTVVAHRDQGSQPPYGAVRIGAGGGADGGQAAGAGRHEAASRPPWCSAWRPVARRAEAMVAPISRSGSPVAQAAAAMPARAVSSPASAARQAAQNRPSFRLPSCCRWTQAARWLRSPRCARTDRTAAGRWWSTSSTSGPGWPVAMARLASGWRRHHQVILSGSQVASRNPCRVAGCLLPGWQGNTGQPRAAYRSACSVVRGVTAGPLWRPCGNR